VGVAVGQAGEADLIPDGANDEYQPNRAQRGGQEDGSGQRSGAHARTRNDLVLSDPASQGLARDRSRSGLRVSTTGGAKPAARLSTESAENQPNPRSLTKAAAKPDPAALTGGSRLGHEPVGEVKASQEVCD
jgi:hypothetical protein